MNPPVLHLTLGLGMPAGAEWVVIMLALLLLFGKRLPEVMRGLGGSVKEFKKGLEDASPTSPVPPPPTARATDRIATVEPQMPHPPGQAPAGPGKETPLSAP